MIAIEKYVVYGLKYVEDVFSISVLDHVRGSIECKLDDLYTQMAYVIFLCCMDLIFLDNKEEAAGSSGSTAGSSGSLDFRDIYISIDLFQAAYVWIKFRDVIPRGAVYHRPNSNKFEPRIKFPVTRGVGGKSKRIPLGLYDTAVEAGVAYNIAAFYCKKRKHTGRLDLGGGAYFSIPALGVDPNLPYEEQVNQVRDQVLKVYAEFEECKASRNLLPSVPGLASEMPTRESRLIPTSPIQQLGQPGNLEINLATQVQGSQLAPNGVDFNNLGCVLPECVKTQHKLLEAEKLIECLKQRISELEREELQPHPFDLEFDIDEI